LGSSANVLPSRTSRKKAQEKLSKEALKKVDALVKEKKITPITTADGKEGFNKDELAMAAARDILGDYSAFLKEKHFQKAADYVKEKLLDTIDADNDQLITRDEIKSYHATLPPKPKKPDEQAR
jgi:hypothetical protein